MSAFNGTYIVTTKNILSMKLLILSLLLGVFPCLYAVNNLRLPDMRSMGMGGCAVTQSFLFNPALIGLESCKSIDINYFNRYGLKELGTVGLSFSYPNNVLPFGVNISSFGYDQYRESMFRLFFGRSLNDKWNIGISIQYSIVQTELTEEHPQYLSTDIGISYSPVEKLLIGMLIMDFPSVAVKKENTEIDYFRGHSLQIGFQWEVINSLLIIGNVGTNKHTTLTGNIGLEYQLYKQFYVRAGMQTTPLLPTVGVGYCFLGFTVDVATVYHPVLGISTGIGLKYSF